MDDNKNLPVAIDDIAEEKQFSMENKQVAWLRILQKGSPVCDPDNPSYNPDAKPGMFMNSVTGELYGTKIKVVVLDFNELWIEYLPKRGGFVNRYMPHDPAVKVDTSDFSNWVNTDNGNTIEDTYNYYVVVVGHEADGVQVLALQSTGIKPAKVWNSKMTNVKTSTGKMAAKCTSVWELETVKLPNPKGEGFYYSLGDKGSTHINFVSRISAIPNFYETIIQPRLEEIKTLQIDYAGASEQLTDNAGKDTASQY